MDASKPTKQIPSLPNLFISHGFSAPPVQSGEARLFIDLIPSTAWGSNVRSRYPGEWDVFRRGCYRAAHHRCEVCGDSGVMECHELWSYAKPPVQKLERLICLCNLCHSAQHYGYASVKGITKEVDAHIRHVNAWSKRQLDAHVKKAFKIWDARNKIQWETHTALLDAAAETLKNEKKQYL